MVFRYHWAGPSREQWCPSFPDRPAAGSLKSRLLGAGDDGPINPTGSKRAHGTDPWGKHHAGKGGAERGPSNGLSLYTASSRSPRYAGSGLLSAAARGFRPWVLLARSRLRSQINLEDSGCVLAEEDSAQPGARCASIARGAPPRLEGAGGVGVRDAPIGFARSEARSVPCKQGVSDEQEEKDHRSSGF